MWFYIALGILLAVYILNKRIFSYWERHGVPSVPGSFIVGSVWEGITIQKHFGVITREWYQKFSNFPYIGYYNSFTPVVLVRDLELVKDVLIKDFNSFSGNEFQANEHLDSLLTGNAFFVSGEKWKYNRMLMSPQFSNARVKNLFPLMKTTCDKFEKYLNACGSENHDSRELAAKFTTENSIMCAFTYNAESFKNPKADFRTMGRKMFEQNKWNALKFIILSTMPLLGEWLRLSIVPKYVDKFFRNFLKSNIASRNEVPGEDILQTFLQSAQAKKVPESVIFAHSMSFFVEGFETSSGVLSYAMFELARNPDVQAKLYDEIISVLAEFNDELSFEALQKMDYLEAILNETLRLYPVLLTLHKVCTIPYEFRPIQGQKRGYKMPKGSTVVIPVHAIHRDPEYYPDPERFYPERFLPEQRQSIPKGAFLGFGEGPRMCIGMKFGQVQIKAALSTILKSFHIKLSPDCPPYEIDPAFFLNAPLRPILLNFVKR